VIEVEHLTKRYRGAAAVDDLSFNVPRGRITGFLGPNGAGKPVACGWIQDRFGVRWQIVPAALMRLMEGSDRERAKRVAEAMMKMVKLDVATLEKA